MIVDFLTTILSSRIFIVLTNSQSGFFATKTGGQSWMNHFQIFTYGYATVANLWATTAMNNGTGMYQAIALYQQNLFWTTDAWTSGTWWYITNSYPWKDIAISSSGQLFVAPMYGIGLYYSKNYGQNWYAISNANYYINTVAINNAGNYVVCGSGNGGVFMVQNALTTPSYYQSSGPPTATWTGSDISATGQYVVVVSSAVGIYVSTTFGSSFSKATSAPTLSYTSVACSSNGQYMAATYQSSGGIYYSNNFGVTWTSASSAPSAYYTGVAASSSGRYMYASTYPGKIYFSADFGQSWSVTPTVPTTMPTPSPGVNGRSLLYQNWTCVATSTTGQYVYATQGTGFIYQSSNQGVTFTLSSAPPGQWTGVSTSVDGKVVAATIYVGGIYVSKDYGATWTNTPSLNLQWYSVAISSTGQNMTACVFGGTIYTSNNYGASWARIGQGYNQYWFAVAMSLNAKYQAAVVYNDPLGEYVFVGNGNTRTWTKTLLGSNNVQLTSIAISSTGQYMTTGGLGGPLYYSNNYGASWYTSGSLSMQWCGVGMSSTGQYQAAGIYGGTIYYSSNYGVSWAISNAPVARWIHCASNTAGTVMYCVAQGKSIATSTTYGATWNVLTGTAVPSARPTFSPSLTPTRVPTQTPTRTPTRIPT
eukprot:gene13771-9861_t